MPTPTRRTVVNRPKPRGLGRLQEGRTYREVRRLGAELAADGPHVTGTRIDSGIAVLHDWHSWWAGAHEGRLCTEADLPRVLTAWHRALWEAHLTCDFAHPEHDPGVADEDDRIRPGGMDVRLRELFGIRVLHEWWPHEPLGGETVTGSVTLGRFGAAVLRP